MPQSWGHFRRSDLPVHFAIAEGWTVGDMYQQGVIAVSEIVLFKQPVFSSYFASSQPTLIVLYGKLAVLRTCCNHNADISLDKFVP